MFIHLHTLSETIHYCHEKLPDLLRSTFFEQLIPSYIHLSNMYYLQIKFSINDQFGSIVQSLNQLKLLCGCEIGDGDSPSHPHSITSVLMKDCAIIIHRRSVTEISHVDTVIQWIWATLWHIRPENRLLIRSNHIFSLFCVAQERQWIGTLIIVLLPVFIENHFVTLNRRSNIVIVR